MFDFQGRTKLILGDGALDKLAKCKVAVFGIGGVGSYTVEALARGGIGNLVLVDSDNVALSNINRQIHALHSTVGRPKVEVMAERVRDINPEINIKLYQEFYTPEKRSELILKDYDYVVDAVDTVSAKIDIIMGCQELQIPIISSMGAGNKLDPTAFEVADIYETSMCPLAKVMRYELKKRGVKNLKVVYSKEPPAKIDYENLNLPCEDTNVKKRFIPGSLPFVPSVVGLIIAGEVIKDLI